MTIIVTDRYRGEVIACQERYVSLYARTDEIPRQEG